MTVSRWERCCVQYTHTGQCTVPCTTTQHSVELQTNLYGLLLVESGYYFHIFKSMKTLLHVKVIVAAFNQ